MTTSLVKRVFQEWATIELDDDESVRLAEAAARSTADPRVDPARFREEAKNGWAALNQSTRNGVEQFAKGTTSRPEVYVTNLPVDPDLPATPLIGQTTDAVTNTLGEFIMVTFSLALGFPISYRDQRAGRLVHDVYPTSKNAEKVSSQSSSVSLGFHTEMFFHPAPPDFLILHCLRADPAGKAATSIASLTDIQRQLTVQEIAVLTAPMFAMDLARLHGTYRCEGRPIRHADPRPVFQIIDEHAGGVQFRFEPELTTAVGPEARQAMAAADNAAEAVSVSGRLEQGGMLLLDNRRAVHSRSPFRANFDGNDRWLRRMMVGSHPSGDSSGGLAARGFHERPDLELAKAWERTGASLQVIPYSTQEQMAQTAAPTGAAMNQTGEGH
ncbi:L-asparagine oxygenase [Pseudarthrobacter siccitolerans]|uniref:L-asparagine oxygenase n=1 Tax=Pseudarthrobacter siccitolerans TaxID=861266 RepID=A0ABU0PME0_9MICC|nr:TauD/TfdA family dioxygenase [Pseudarthrobacter siccitolerans]MDQ0674732.1 L-asparagine oxygenase [Pseudarthrobacter siccitolerans]